MFETSRDHVRGGVVPSSKKDLGIVAAVGRLNAALVKAVADDTIGAAAELPFGKVSPRCLIPGDCPLIESIDGAGEMPMPPFALRVMGYTSGLTVRMVSPAIAKRRGEQYGATQEGLELLTYHGTPHESLAF